MTQQEDASLWDSFWRGCDSARESLIALYAPYVRVVAAKLFSSRSDPGFEFDDYLQFGMVGLIESLDRYRRGSEATFKTFAYYRVRGAILDGVAGLSDRQRQISHYARLRKDRLTSLSAGTVAEDEESIDDALNRIGDVVVDLAIGVLMEGSAFCHDESAMADDPRYRDFELRQMQGRVMRIIDDLSTDQAKVLRLHYLQDWPFDDIAEHMGLSKGRISQLHKKAIAEIRELL